jgi:hypothetical protein
MVCKCIWIKGTNNKLLTHFGKNFNFPVSVHAPKPKTKEQSIKYITSRSQISNKRSATVLLSSLFPNHIEGKKAGNCHFINYGSFLLIDLLFLGNSITGDK